MAVDRHAVLPSGALEGDRRWVLVDEQGNWVNGKREPAIHRVRMEFDWPAREVACAQAGFSPTRFHLEREAEELGEWLGHALGRQIRLVENRERGWPDDGDAPGPTLIGESTLRRVASWFPSLTVDEVRRRFRANLELADTEPFAEDRWVAVDGRDVPFWIGDVEFGGVNPCQRCVVPTRASDTGEPSPLFVRDFASRRERELPSWAPRSRFDHFYRLALNTRLRSLGSGMLATGMGVGDERPRS